MVMSNIKNNRNSAKVNGARSASKSNHHHQKLQQEEFGSEFELDNVNNLAQMREKTDTKQPVSERTAWH